MRDDEKSTRKPSDAEIRDLPEKPVRPEGEEAVVGGRDLKRGDRASSSRRGGRRGSSTGDRGGRSKR